MRIRSLALALLIFLSVSCSEKSLTENPTAPRSYNGTASVGDFLTITLNPADHTLSYTNLSNGDSGTVSYAVNADGTYTLSDPSGNLVAAYEVPNYALIVQAAKTGPSHDMPALITAVQKGSISVSTWAGRGFNYMQFRTSAGGLEVGSATMDSQGSVSISSYWPYGSMGQGSNAFNQGGFDASLFQQDPSGTFLKLADNNGSFDYIFGTPNGIFAVDTPNGAILGLKKAASKDFDPAFAGTYSAIYYEKTGATTGMNNAEAGTPSLGKATLTISTTGQVTVLDAQGQTIVQTSLTPVADAPYLYGGQGLLQSPCYGLFTFRVTTANSQRDVFVTFMDRALLFASFRADLPWGSGNTYDYLYGVGLK
jgi:hypothetical protein